jgi:hypothetical protein
MSGRPSLRCRERFFFPYAPSVPIGARGGVEAHTHLHTHTCWLHAVACVDLLCFRMHHLRSHRPVLTLHRNHYGFTVMRFLITMESLHDSTLVRMSTVWCFQFFCFLVRTTPQPSSPVSSTPDSHRTREERQPPRKRWSSTSQPTAGSPSGSCCSSASELVPSPSSDQVTT